jgi:hypothetical protein
MVMRMTGNPVWGADLSKEAVARHVANGGKRSNLKDIMANCDIVVSTTGAQGLIKPEMVRKGQIILALEGMLSLTFTDYLDDVSTIYITYPELLEKAGPLTAALANRQGEYLNSEPVIVPTGTIRGNANSNDFFGTITFRASIPMDMGSGQFKVRNKSSKTIRCPKF